MDSLQLCAQAFASLLNIKYHFLLGRTGKIPLSNLGKSRYFPIIQKRIDPLTHLEEILDSNRFVFRYNTNRQTFSRIKADIAETEN